jgi:hypothetical protein
MSDENKTGDDINEKLRQRRKKFERACCEYIEEFGFEWIEEFTLNGA